MAHKDKKPTRKIVKNGRESYYVNIPKEYIRHLDWRERQKVVVEEKDGKIVIKDWEDK